MHRSWRPCHAADPSGWGGSSARRVAPRSKGEGVPYDKYQALPVEYCGVAAAPHLRHTHTSSARQTDHNNHARPPKLSCRGLVRSGRSASAAERPRAAHSHSPSAAQCQRRSIAYAHVATAPPTSGSKPCRVVLVFGRNRHGSRCGREELRPCLALLGWVRAGQADEIVVLQE